MNFYKFRFSSFHFSHFHVLLLISLYTHYMSTAHPSPSIGLMVAEGFSIRDVGHLEEETVVGNVVSVVVVVDGEPHHGV